MKEEVLTTSDSIVTSLCREIEYIRNRYASLITAINNSHDKILKQRLLTEINNLLSRKEEITSIANSFNGLSNREDLARLFFLELCNRPIEFII